MSTSTDAAPNAEMNAPKSTKPGFLERMKERFADPNPILVKELQTLFRLKLFIRFLYLSTAGLAFVILMMGASTASGMNPAKAGQVLFQVFFSLIAGIVALVAPAAASTALTTERETETYESLILTGMDPAKIVTGKFLANFVAFTVALVAFFPLVGVGFLFGGITPTDVLFAFLGILLSLAIAVSFGLSVSARVRSTRVSLLLSITTSAPISMMIWGMITAIGEAVDHDWELVTEGPFWFAEALSQRFFELDTFTFAFVFPILLTILLVWFFLASAIAGVRHSSEDRNTPFKIWSLFAVPVGWAILGALTGVLRPRDWDEALPIFSFCFGFFMLFLALLFANEPPLPPRTYEEKVEDGGFWVRFRSRFGPGAAPTARFATLLLIAAAAGGMAIQMVVATFIDPAALRHETVLGNAMVMAGNCAVSIWALYFASYLRVTARSAVLSRVIVIGSLFLLSLVPIFLLATMDPTAFRDADDHLPWAMRFVPFAHIMTGFEASDDRDLTRLIEGIPALAFYGGLAFLLFAMLERRCAAIATNVRQYRASRNAAADAAYAARNAQREAAKRAREEAQAAMMAASATPASAASPDPAPNPGSSEEPSTES